MACGLSRAASSGSFFKRTRKSSWIDLPAFNGLAIFSAKPGDVLPDGRIATAIKSSGSDMAGAVLGESSSDGGSLALSLDVRTPRSMRHRSSILKTRRWVTSWTQRPGP